MSIYGERFKIMNDHLVSVNAKVTACNTGAVVVASSALPAGASSEASLSALSAKVTACDTGAVAVTSCALPAGASSEASLSALSAKVTACDTGAVVVSSSALPSGASSEASLSALSAKVTACDTGAVVVASSALPSGASDSAKQDEIKALIGATNSALAGTLSVSAPAPVKSASTPIGSGSLQAINGQATHTSAEVDLGTSRHISFFGNSSDTASSHEVDLLVSDSSGGTYYKTAHSGFYSEGDVHVIVRDVPYRYVKLRIKNGDSAVGNSADFRLHLLTST